MSQNMLLNIASSVADKLIAHLDEEALSGHFASEPKNERYLLANLISKALKKTAEELELSLSIRVDNLADCDFTDMVEQFVNQKLGQAECAQQGTLFCMNCCQGEAAQVALA